MNYSHKHSTVHMEQDQEFVDYVVKAIVNKPDAVKTERTVDERGVLITLDVDPSDMGYVIGRQGQTARSLRTLLKIVGAKNNARVNLKISEPEGGRGFGNSSAAPAATAAAPASEEVAEAPVEDVMEEINLDDVDTSAVDLDI
jgi:predicted RNA-binding protein YlqC (UPF0109 family)